MPSGGDQSPPPPPPAPAAAGSEEEEEEEEDDDGEAEDSALPTRTPTPQTQQRFDELCCRLNMDEAARAEAWDSYRSMSESYTLEVRPGGRRGEVFPGLVVTPAAGGDLSALPPGRAPRRDPLTGPGVGTPAARIRPGNLAFEKLLAAPKANPVLLLFPLGFRMGNTCCPNAAPRGRGRAGVMTTNGQPPGRQKEQVRLWRPHR